MTILRKESDMLSTLNRLIDGIPVTEYASTEAKTARGVFFLVHGHTGNRGHLAELATRVAEAGWLAVTVDAYLHGERRGEPYFSGDGRAQAMAMPEVLLHTCADLKHLTDTFYAAYAPHFFYGGTSMGGHIAFQMPKYVKAEAIMPLIGSPDMYRHYAVTKYPLVGLKGIETLKPALDQLEIGPDYTPYMDVRIVIEIGADDPVVDYHFVVDFHDALVRAGHEDIMITLYPVGHVVTDEMQEAALIALCD
ncbi:MAG: dienelactone hydrolase family protein [Bacillota bacterium]|nr:dienelactone hydrolase family protein [Bacillota bacterium]